MGQEGILLFVVALCAVTSLCSSANETQVQSIINSLTITGPCKILVGKNTLLMSSSQACDFIKKYNYSLSDCGKDEKTKLEQAICGYGKSTTSFSSTSHTQTTVVTLAPTSPTTQASSSAVVTLAPTSPTTKASSSAVVTLAPTSPTTKASSSAVVTLAPTSPATQASSSASEATNEKEQRAKVLALVETLSTELCRNVIKTQAANENITFQSACKTLETFAVQISLIQCDDSDYAKLHAAICDYCKEHPDVCVETSAVPTQPPTSAPVVIDENEERKKILALVQTLSTETCRKTVSTYASNEEITLEMACTTLESLEEKMPLVQCSEADYKKLHKAICEHIFDNNCDPDILQWREDVKIVMDTKLTADCAPLAKAQSDDNTTPEEACEQLLTFKTAMLIVCEQTDFNEMYTAVCEYKNKSEEIRTQQVLSVLKTVSTTCSDVVNDFLREGLAEACNRTILSRQTLVINNICTESEFSHIHEAICKKEISCENTTGNNNENTKSPREIRVETVIKRLSERCSNVMMSGFEELSELPEKACNTLNKTKESLLRGNLCTDQDFTKLMQVVCDDADPNADLTEEDLQRAEALSVIENGLTTPCHKLLWSQVQQFTGSLERGCYLLQSAGPTLIQVGTCTQEDYDKLEPKVCARPGASDDKEWDLKQNVKHVVHNDVTSSCKDVMAIQIEAEKEQPLSASCEKLTSFKDTLVTGGICTEEDFRKLENAICVNKNDDASTLTVSLLMLSLCILLSFIPRY